MPSREVKLPSEVVRDIEKPTLKSFPKYEQNPFTTEMMKRGFSTSIKRSKEMENSAIVNTVTGEVGGSLAIGVVTEVDRESFVKLYTNDLASLLGLSITANRLFLIIMKVMQDHKDRDQIDLSVPLVNHYIDEHIERLALEGKKPDKSFKKITRSSFYNAVAELISNDIIAPCLISKEKYWINPMRIYNGDRLTLGKLYMITESKRKDMQRLEQQEQLESQQLSLSDASDEDSPY